jgi:hypothetical protein
MPHQLRLYYDSQLKYPVDIFDFGRVEVGEDGFLVFYMKNMSEKWPIVDISVDIPPVIKECKMVEMPSRIGPDKTAKCRYKCSPDLNSDEPLVFLTKIKGRLEIG